MRLCKRPRLPYSVAVTDGARHRGRERKLHQHVSAGRRRGAGALGAAFAALALIQAAGPARADGGPSGAMMTPVRALVAFMSTLPEGGHPGVFAAHGLCIVENYAPFLFCGADAAARWEEGFRAHSAADGLAALSAQFGAAQDFSVSGRRAYFSLPTTWRGLTHGRRFEEHGAWAFVLERAAGGWRILGYGWGVTAYSEDPPPT